MVCCHVDDCAFLLFELNIMYSRCY